MRGLFSMIWLMAPSFAVALIETLIQMINE